MARWMRGLEDVAETADQFWRGGLIATDRSPFSTVRSPWPLRIISASSRIAYARFVQKGFIVHAMTRDEKIRKALEVLKPPPRQRAECQHDIELALDMLEQRAVAARSFRVAKSKKGKAGLKRYYAALLRLRNAYQSLDPAIRPWFSLVETAYISGKPTIIDREITMAEVFLAQPSASPRRDASSNKIAVGVASYLLDWWGHKASVTRGGKWEKLAKILTRDVTTDLFDHLRKFKRRPGPRIEKLRGEHSIVYRTRR
jgi:hypothetical protein